MCVWGGGDLRGRGWSGRGGGQESICTIPWLEYDLCRHSQVRFAVVPYVGIT